jgi:hypothetical protein
MRAGRHFMEMMNRNLEQYTVEATSPSQLAGAGLIVGAALPTLWAILAISTLLTVGVVLLLRDYNYEHAWVSAHFAVMARTFVQEGVLALGGVPVQNNLPLTTSPDAYLNWPPLYPILVSIVFRLLGESETVHHLIATTITLGTAGVLFVIVRRWSGPLPGAIAAVTFLNAPLVARFGHLGLHLHLAILLCLLGLYAHCRALDAPSGTVDRRWAAAAASLMFLAALTSWEPVLAPGGLLVVGVFCRDRRAQRLAIVAGATAMVGALSVFALYAVQHTHFLDQIVERVLLRAGLSGGYEIPAGLLSDPHFIQEQAELPGIQSNLSYLITVILGRLSGLGPVGLIAITTAVFAAPWIWVRQRRPLAMVTTGMAVSYVLWAVFMRNHMQVHSYETVLILPVAALCAGALAAAVLETCRGTRHAAFALALVCVAMPTTAVLGRIDPTIQLMWANRKEQLDIRFAKWAQTYLPENAVVVYPSRDMVPVYYLSRHTIRAVVTEAMLIRAQRSIIALCTSCPVYLALPIRDAGQFPEASSGHLGQVVEERPDLGKLILLYAPPVG